MSAEIIPFRPREAKALPPPFFLVLGRANPPSYVVRQWWPDADFKAEVAWHGDSYRAAIIDAQRLSAVWPGSAIADFVRGETTSLGEAPATAEIIPFPDRPCETKPQERRGIIVLDARANHRGCQRSLLAPFWIEVGTNQVAWRTVIWQGNSYRVARREIRELLRLAGDERPLVDVIDWARPRRGPR